MDRRKCGCMKTYQTNAVCPKCGKLLLTTDIPAYAFVCPDCDENFYGIEIMDYFGDEFEISAECTGDVFSENLDKLKNLLPDHLMDFIGYDKGECLFLHPVQPYFYRGLAVLFRSSPQNVVIDHKNIGIKIFCR